MKKTLLIACATLASGAAFAQSSVTLYGLADMYLSSQKNPATGLRTTRLDSSGIYESHFGFKGSEDLGGGLKASFSLEHGLRSEEHTSELQSH